MAAVAGVTALVIGRRAVRALLAERVPHLRGPRRPARRSRAGLGAHPVGAELVREVGQDQPFRAGLAPVLAGLERASGGPRSSGGSGSGSVASTISRSVPAANAHSVLAGPAVGAEGEPRAVARRTRPRWPGCSAGRAGSAPRARRARAARRGRRRVSRTPARGGRRSCPRPRRLGEHVRAPGGAISRGCGGAPSQGR